MLRFDRGNCGTKILNAIEAGDLKVEVSDYSNLYSLESIFWDKSICKNWQQALYMQWRHQNPDVSIQLISKLILIGRSRLGLQATRKQAQRSVLRDHVRSSRC